MAATTSELRLLREGAAQETGADRAAFRPGAGTGRWRAQPRLRCALAAVVVLLTVAFLLLPYGGSVQSLSPVERLHAMPRRIVSLEQLVWSSDQGRGGRVPQAPPLEVGEVNSQPTPATNDTSLPKRRQVDIAVCTIDAARIAGHLGLFGVTISQSTNDCKPTTTNKQACASDVSNIVGHITVVAALISDMVVNCESRVDPRAVCANVVTTIVGLTGLLAGASANVQQLCTSPANKNRSWNTLVYTDGRRLLERFDLPAFGQKNSSNLSIALPDPVDIKQKRDRDIAFCVFDVLLATSLAAEMGVQINNAITTCQSEDSDTAKRLCAVNVLGIISSFGLASNFVSGAVAACPAFKTQEYASCASNILTMVGTLAGIGSAAANYKACEANVTALAQNTTEVQ